jgi:hypothetical protein
MFFFKEIPKVSVQKSQSIGSKTPSFGSKTRSSVRKPEVSVRKPEVSVQNPKISGKFFGLKISVKVVHRNASVAETRNLDFDQDY